MFCARQDVPGRVGPWGCGHDHDVDRGLCVDGGGYLAAAEPGLDVADRWAVRRDEEPNRTGQRHRLRQRRQRRNGLCRWQLHRSQAAGRRGWCQGEPARIDGDRCGHRRSDWLLLTGLHPRRRTGRSPLSRDLARWIEALCRWEVHPRGRAEPTSSRPTERGDRCRQWLASPTVRSGQRSRDHGRRVRVVCRRIVQEGRAGHSQHAGRVRYGRQRLLDELVPSGDPGDADLLSRPLLAEHPWTRPVAR